MFCARFCVEVCLSKEPYFAVKEPCISAHESTWTKLSVVCGLQQLPHDCRSPSTHVLYK